MVLVLFWRTAIEAAFAAFGRLVRVTATAKWSEPYVPRIRYPMGRSVLVVAHT